MINVVFNPKTDSNNQGSSEGISRNSFSINSRPSGRPHRKSRASALLCHPYLLLAGILVRKLKSEEGGRGED
jgi:hypothetical protein